MNLRRLLISALAWIAFVVPAIAQEQSAVVPFADGTITLPIPAGFAGPSSTPRAALDAMAQGYGPKNRVMAVLLEKADLLRVASGERPNVTRYVIVHTERETEASGMAPAQFEAVEAEFRSLGEVSLRAAEPEIAAADARMSSALGKATGDSIESVKSGRENVLGVFDERPDSIAVVSLATVSHSARTGAREFQQVAAVGFARVKDSAVEVAAYSDYTSAEDIEWAKQIIRSWLTQLAVLNGSVAIK